MSVPSAFKALLLLDAAWCAEQDPKRLSTKHQVPLSDRRSRLVAPASDVTVRLRDKAGNLVLDDGARLYFSEDTGKATLHSVALGNELLERNLSEALLCLLFEQSGGILRIIAQFSDRGHFEKLSEERPELRFASYDLPPHSVTQIDPSYSRDGMDADSLYEVLVSYLQTFDPPLYSIHTEKFLKAPHIVVPLLSHLASLTAEDNLKFPIELRRLSDQFRTILEMKDSPLAIRKVKRDHLNAWAELQNKRVAFVDGGVAKIAGLPGTEPTALRVGIYCVRPGDTKLDSRELWKLIPFVVGDIIDKNTGVVMEDDQHIDLRRLGEAARYVLEPLSALRFVDTQPELESIFLHGPLINQFVQYDEGEPNFVPFLKEEFLAAVGITKSLLEADVKDIPKSKDGKAMWRQFMAVYAYITHRIVSLSTPMAGVVERSAGTWLAQAVLRAAVGAQLIKDSYRKKVLTLLKRYDISDDFLFGCVLAEGEYITPTQIPKNEVRRARPHWHPVVAQYSKPFATLLKTSEFSFPFRVELNDTGNLKQQEIMRTLYHTARLLPRYAFPVGLDIVDKYAKVPDWLSRNISARVAAAVLNRTIAEGDARMVSQVRQLLAHTPRDFFYRPQS